MIKTFFTGRIGKDAETRHTQSGAAVASFSVAVDIGYGDKKETLWLDCSIWGKRAEGGLIQYLVKGAQVAITGDLSAREYNGKTYLQVRVDEIDLMGKGASKPKAEQHPMASLDDFEDPPF